VYLITIGDGITHLLDRPKQLQFLLPSLPGNFHSRITALDLTRT
jgi:hypothetical protein